MLIWLEFYDGGAALMVRDHGHITEVRGHRGIGTRYVGDRLDRVLKALPKRVNISALFADEKVFIRNADHATAIRAALEFEEDLIKRMLSSTMVAAPPASAPRDAGG